MSYNFKNKKILITGSTSGLGLVCAKNFIETKIPGKKIRNAEKFLPLINLLCSSEGEILTGSSILADTCETKAYNLN